VTPRTRVTSSTKNTFYCSHLRDEPRRIYSSSLRLEEAFAAAFFLVFFFGTYTGTPACERVCFYLFLFYFILSFFLFGTHTGTPTFVRVFVCARKPNTRTRTHTYTQAFGRMLRKHDSMSPCITYQSRAHKQLPRSARARAVSAWPAAHCVCLNT
jgi:hypothetical protein